MEAFGICEDAIQPPCNSASVFAIVVMIGLSSWTCYRHHYQFHSSTGSMCHDVHRVADFEPAIVHRLNYPRRAGM